MKRRAFTLIELAAVMAILAVIAAAVAINMRGPISRARARDLPGEIRHFDYITRASAQSMDQDLKLLIDIPGGRLRRLDPMTATEIGRPMQLPTGWRIDQVRIAGSDEPIRRESAVIACSPAGLTPTYALKLTGPQDRTTWLLVAGLTGESMEVNNDDSIEEIFQTLSQGHDAG